MDQITLLLSLEAVDKATKIVDAVTGKIEAWTKATKASAAFASRSSAEIQAANMKAAASAASYERAVASQAKAQAGLSEAMEVSKGAQLEAAAASRAGSAEAAASARYATTAVDAEEAALLRLERAEHLVATRSREMAVAQQTASGPTKSHGALLKGVAVAALATSLAIVAVGAKSVEAAGKFQSSTQRLVSSAGEQEANIGKVRQGILKLAGDVGYSTDALSAGFYKASSAGFNFAHGGLDVVRAAAEGAKAENADLSTVVDAVSSAMVDYHAPASQAALITSKLVEATSLGKTSFEELAGAMPAILPVASAAHVSLSDILADLSAMTIHGMSAQQAAQNLADTIRHMENPTAQQAKELALLGMTTTQLAGDLKAKGLSGTLQEISGRIQKLVLPGSDKVILNLKTALSGLPPAVQKLGEQLVSGTISMGDYSKAAQALDPISAKQAMSFATLAGSTHRIGDEQMSGAQVMQNYTQALAKATGDASGLNVALMLTGENSKTVNSAVLRIAQTTTEAGNHVRSWGETQKTFNQRLDELKGKLEAAKIGIGEGLLPAVTSLTTSITKALAPLTSWISIHPKLTAEILETVAAVGVATAAIIGLNKAWTSIKLAYDLVLGSSGMVTKAMGAVNGAVAFVTTAAKGGGEEVGRFSNALTAAKDASANTKGGLAGLASFLTGPWVAGIGIAVVAATALITHFTERAAEQKRAVDSLAGSLHDLSNNYNEGSGAGTEYLANLVRTNDQFRQMVIDTGRLGLGVTTVSQALHGNRAALTQLNSSYDTYIGAAQNALDVLQKTGTDVAVTGQQWSQYQRTMSQYPQIAAMVKTAQDQLQQGNDAGMQALQKYIDTLQQQKDAAGQAAKTSQDQAAALGIVAGQTSTTAGTTSDFAAAMATVNSATATATDRVNALKTAEDALNGVAVNADQAAEHLATAHDQLAEAVRTAARSHEAGARSLGLNTAAGRANHDAVVAQLAAITDEYNANYAAGTSLKDLATKHDQEIAALKRQGAQLGLSKADIQHLIDVYGQVPPGVTTNFNAPGLADVIAKCKTLHDKIAALSSAGVSISAGDLVTRRRGNAAGGPIDGPGTETSDSIPAWLSRGEHVWSAAEVRQTGGHAAVAALRHLALTGSLAPRLAAGGTTAVAASLSTATHIGRFNRGGPVYPQWTPTSSAAPAAPAGGDTYNVVTIDLRGTQVMSDRDIDVLIDKIDRRLVRTKLPGAGVHVRR